MGLAAGRHPLEGAYRCGEADGAYIAALERRSDILPTPTIPTNVDGASAKSHVPGARKSFRPYDSLSVVHENR